MAKRCASTRGNAFLTVTSKMKLPSLRFALVAVACMSAFTVKGADTVTLEIRDYAELPITGKVDSRGNNDSMLARVNGIHEEPGGGTRLFVHDLNGPLYIVEKDTKKLTTYLDFNGRPGHTGLFPRFAYEVGFANGVVSVFAPIAPGLKQVSFSYSLPAKSFPLSLPLEKETGVYEIMIEEPSGTVTGPHLREVDPVTVDERNFRRFLASDMPENSVALINLPPPPRSARSIDPRYLVAITLIIGGTMVLALAQALRRR